MKTILPILITTIILSGCSEQKADSDKKTETNKTEEAQAKQGESDKNIEDNVPTKRNLATKDFYGTYFKVEYPEDFVASPTEPVDTYPESDMKYVDTDEAKFLSPDRLVEFYVFSPQWGGTSEYTDTQFNETLIQDKTKETESELDGVVTTNWQTFEAKDKSYTRSCVTITTENTIKIFGVKFANQKAYNLYKPEYLAFKKSLEQYAD